MIIGVCRFLSNVNKSSVNLPNTYTQVCMYHQIPHPKILHSTNELCFLCSVWISEQTVIIVLYRIN